MNVKNDRGDYNSINILLLIKHWKGFNRLELKIGSNSSKRIASFSNFIRIMIGLYGQKREFNIKSNSLFQSVLFFYRKIVIQQCPILWIRVA